MLNKKLGLFAILMCLTSFAYADCCRWCWNNPYAGVDVQWDYFGGNHPGRKNVAGGSVFGGYRWTSLGLEVGATSYLHRSQSTPFVKPRYNLYVDGSYYYPLAKQLDLRLLVGAGYLSTEQELTANVRHMNEQWGVRLGAGLQYNFTRHWNSGLMYKYQSHSHFDVSNVSALALSLAYVF